MQCYDRKSTLGNQTEKSVFLVQALYGEPLENHPGAVLIRPGATPLSSNEVVSAIRVEPRYRLHIVPEQSDGLFRDFYFCQLSPSFQNQKRP